MSTTFEVKTGRLAILEAAVLRWYRAREAFVHNPWTETRERAHYEAELALRKVAVEILQAQGLDTQAE